MRSAVHTSVSFAHCALLGGVLALTQAVFRCTCWKSLYSSVQLSYVTMVVNISQRTGA